MYDEYISERDDYVGLGSGAFSYLQGSLYASTFDISHYMLGVETGQAGTARCRVLSERDQMRYYLLMRLFSGSLDKERAEDKFGGAFQRKLWPELTVLQTIHAIHDWGDRFALNERGYYLWVVLMREFFSSINSLREQARHDIVQGPPELRAKE